MDSHESRRDAGALHARVTRASTLAALTTAAAGTLVLCGWAWNVESLKTIYGPITMKTNAAIGLLLCSGALLALRAAPRASMVLAVCAGLLAGSTMCEHLFGWNLGIDQLLFTEAPGAAATSSPNRMGLNASTSFLLTAVALFQMARGGIGRVTMAQSLALVGIILASIPLVGYLYGAEQLYGVAQYTGIALHTALAFIILHAGILLARADVGPMSVFISRGPAGTVLRRLAFPIVAIPLALGYVEIYARGNEFLDRGLGMALYAVSLIVVLGVTVWQTSLVIERSDHARRRAQRDRDLLIVRERDARAEAERASHLKDQFLATLSHELRTPLNVMLGWTQILERGKNPEDHVRIAGLVAKNGRLLARLVEDLLDLSRVTAGQFDISRLPISLNTVVQGALDGVALAAEAKGIHVVAELDPAMGPIDADAQRLQQIVFNLLSNAVKFTPTGGRIVVRTSDTVGTVVATVADSGIGFDQAFASEIFKPFRQADSSTRREHGGLGLGLSIARHIAELHGGTLTASSPGPGQGAKFALTLFRTAPVTRHTASAGASGHPNDDARVESSPGSTVAVSVNRAVETES